uniref:RNA polymerase sigma factor n=1 Tax=Herbidospora sakaeratensis TaxID=564415 RepID=UPI000A3F4D0A|nr:sigma factor-like helix-turn-helix DNA-binding protein [Herbidospora sakaeratensis]
MEHDLDEQRPPAGLSDVPVQQSEEAQVPEIWLHDNTNQAEADRVDRLAADLDLVNSLALRRFEGPDYDLFAHELAKYGLAVISGWIRRGLIMARCRERGFGGLPEPPLGAFDDPDVVEELAGETVGKALYHFRQDVLLKGKWDPRRRASLRTYFIGQCLIRFSNVYRQWLKTEQRQHILADHDTLDAVERGFITGPEQRLVVQSEVERAIKAISNPRVRHAVLLHAMGMPHREIGEELGISDKAVERMIANERTRMTNRGIR